MDVIKGNCVTCSSINEYVVSNNEKHTFLSFLKEHYFFSEDEYSFLLKNWKKKTPVTSVCLSCAYSIQCCTDIRNIYKSAKTPNKSVHNCSICNSSEFIVKPTNLIIDDCANFLKGLNRNRAVKPKLICLKCQFCVTSWNKAQERLSFYKGSEPMPSTSKDENEEKKIGTNSPTRKRFSLRRELSFDEEPQIKRPSINTNTPKKSPGKPKKDLRNLKSILLNDLEPLKATSDNFNLSRNVLNNKQIMNDISYVYLEEKNLENLKKILNEGKKYALRKSAIKYNKDDVIDVSSSDEEETNVSQNLKKRNNDLTCDVCDRKISSFTFRKHKTEHTEFSPNVRSTRNRNNSKTETSRKAVANNDSKKNLKTTEKVVVQKSKKIVQKGGNGKVANTKDKNYESKKIEEMNADKRVTRNMKKSKLSKKKSRKFNRTNRKKKTNIKVKNSDNEKDDKSDEDITNDETTQITTKSNLSKKTEKSDDSEDETDDDKSGNNVDEKSEDKLDDESEKIKTPIRKITRTKTLKKIDDNHGLKNGTHKTVKKTESIDDVNETSSKRTRSSRKVVDTEKTAKEETDKEETDKEVTDKEETDDEKNVSDETKESETNNKSNKRTKSSRKVVDTEETAKEGTDKEEMDEGETDEEKISSEETRESETDTESNENISTPNKNRKRKLSISKSDSESDREEILKKSKENGKEIDDKSEEDISNIQLTDEESTNTEINEQEENENKEELNGEQNEAEDKPAKRKSVCIEENGNEINKEEIEEEKNDADNKEDENESTEEILNKNKDEINSEKIEGDKIDNGPDKEETHLKRKMPKRRKSIFVRSIKRDENSKESINESLENDDKIKEKTTIDIDEDEINSDEIESNEIVNGSNKEETHLKKKMRKRRTEIVDENSKESINENIENDDKIEEQTTVDNNEEKMEELNDDDDDDDDDDIKIVETKDTETKNVEDDDEETVLVMEEEFVDKEVIISSPMKTAAERKLTQNGESFEKLPESELENYLEKVGA